MRLGNEEYERKFFVSRDRQGIYLVDIANMNIVTIANLESEDAQFDVDFKSRKLILYMSQKIEGKNKIRKIELKQDVFD